MGDVFDMLVSPEAEARWRKCVIESSLDGPGPLQEGSRGGSRIRFMGREVEARWRIVELVPEVRICREYDPGVRSGRDRYLLAPFGLGTTILEVDLEIDAAGLVGLLAVSRRSAIDRELRTDLQHLKAIVEER